MEVKADVVTRNLSDLENDINEATSQCDDYAGCISQSAVALREASEATNSYLHKKVEDVVHRSHSKTGSSTLNLAGRHLGPDSTLSICVCLQNQPMISVIDLSFNSLGEEGGKNIALALITNPYVSQMTLAGNKFGKTKAAAYLVVLLANNHILQKLDLSNNGFDDKDIYLLSGGLMENEYITYIDLSKNSVGDVGAGYLGRALAINNNLDVVNLSENSIRMGGAVLIGKSIMYNYVMTEINLRGNGLAYEGALAVRECLLKNTCLKKLDISNNRINWEGAIVLALGLEVNTTLHTLKVGDNPLTTTGCMDIIDAVKNNCTLMVLDLQNVNVVKEFRQVTQAVKDENPEFKVVYGHVVRKHDVLGLRPERALHPMYKILTYLLDNELRPVELLRIMDKTVSFKLTTEEFVARCQKLGIDIKWYERAELVYYILNADGLSETANATIGYVTLLNSIVKFIEQERLYRLEQRRKVQELTRYQRHILSKHLPQVSVSAEVNALTGGLLDKLGECKDKHDLVSARLAKAVKSLANKKRMYTFDRIHI